MAAKAGEETVYARESTQGLTTLTFRSRRYAFPTMTGNQHTHEHDGTDVCVMTKMGLFCPHCTGAYQANFSRTESQFSVTRGYTADTEASSSAWQDPAVMGHHSTSTSSLNGNTVLLQESMAKVSIPTCEAVKRQGRKKRHKKHTSSVTKRAVAAPVNFSQTYCNAREQQLVPASRRNARKHKHQRSKFTWSDYSSMETEGKPKQADKTSVDAKSNVSSDYETMDAQYSDRSRSKRAAVVLSPHQQPGLGHTKHMSLERVPRKRREQQSKYMNLLSTATNKGYSIRVSERYTKTTQDTGTKVHARHAVYTPPPVKRKIPVQVTESPAESPYSKFVSRGARTKHKAVPNGNDNHAGVNSDILDKSSESDKENIMRGEQSLDRSDNNSTLSRESDVVEIMFESNMSNAEQDGDGSGSDRSWSPEMDLEDILESMESEVYSGDATLGRVFSLKRDKKHKLSPCHTHVANKAVINDKTQIKDDDDVFKGTKQKRSTDVDDAARYFPIWDINREPSPEAMFDTIMECLSEEEPQNNKLHTSDYESDQKDVVEPASVLRNMIFSVGSSSPEMREATDNQFSSSDLQSHSTDKRSSSCECLAEDGVPDTTSSVELGPSSVCTHDTETSFDYSLDDFASDVSDGAAVKSPYGETRRSMDDIIHSTKHLTDNLLATYADGVEVVTKSHNKQKKVYMFETSFVGEDTSNLPERVSYGEADTSVSAAQKPMIDLEQLVEHDKTSQSNAAAAVDSTVAAAGQQRLLSSSSEQPPSHHETAGEMKAIPVENLYTYHEEYLPKSPLIQKAPMSLQIQNNLSLKADINAKKNHSILTEENIKYNDCMDDSLECEVQANLDHWDTDSAEIMLDTADEEDMSSSFEDHIFHETDAYLPQKCEVNVKSVELSPVYAETKYVADLPKRDQVQVTQTETKVIEDKTSKQKEQDKSSGDNWSQIECRTSTDIASFGTKDSLTRKQAKQFLQHMVSKGHSDTRDEEEQKTKDDIQTSVKDVCQTCAENKTVAVKDEEVISETVTTQEVTLVFAWPKNRKKKSPLHKDKFPFRELELHRVTRLSDFDVKMNEGKIIGSIEDNKEKTTSQEKYRTAEGTVVKRKTERSYVQPFGPGCMVAKSDVGSCDSLQSSERGEGSLDETTSALLKNLKLSSDGPESSNLKPFLQEVHSVQKHTLISHTEQSPPPSSPVPSGHETGVEDIVCVNVEKQFAQVAEVKRSSTPPVLGETEGEHVVHVKCDTSGPTTSPCNDVDIGTDNVVTSNSVELSSSLTNTTSLITSVTLADDTPGAGNTNGSTCSISDRHSSTSSDEESCTGSVINFPQHLNRQWVSSNITDTSCVAVSSIGSCDLAAETSSSQVQSPVINTPCENSIVSSNISLAGNVNCETITNTERCETKQDVPHIAIYDNDNIEHDNEFQKDSLNENDFGDKIEARISCVVDTGDDSPITDSDTFSVHDRVRLLEALTSTDPTPCDRSDEKRSSHFQGAMNNTCYIKNSVSLDDHTTNIKSTIDNIDRHETCDNEAAVSSVIEESDNVSVTDRVKHLESLFSSEQNYSSVCHKKEEVTIKRDTKDKTQSLQKLTQSLQKSYCSDFKKTSLTRFRSELDQWLDKHVNSGTIEWTDQERELLGEVVENTQRADSSPVASNREVYEIKVKPFFNSFGFADKESIRSRSISRESITKISPTGTLRLPNVTTVDVTCDDDGSSSEDEDYTGMSPAEIALRKSLKELRKIIRRIEKGKQIDAYASIRTTHCGQRNSPEDFTAAEDAARLFAKSISLEGLNIHPKVVHPIREISKSEARLHSCSISETMDSSVIDGLHDSHNSVDKCDMQTDSASNVDMLSADKDSDETTADSVSKSCTLHNVLHEHINIDNICNVRNTAHKITKVNDSDLIMNQICDNADGIENINKALCNTDNSDLQSQKEGTASLTNKQLLPFDFAQQNIASNSESDSNSIIEATRASLIFGTNKNYNISTLSKPVEDSVTNTNIYSETTNADNLSYVGKVCKSIISNEDHIDNKTYTLDDTVDNDTENVGILSYAECQLENGLSSVEMHNFKISVEGQTVSDNKSDVNQLSSSENHVKDNVGLPSDNINTNDIILSGNDCVNEHLSYQNKIMHENFFSHIEESKHQVNNSTAGHDQVLLDVDYRMNDQLCSGDAAETKASSDHADYIYANICCDKTSIMSLDDSNYGQHDQVVSDNPDNKRSSDTTCNVNSYAPSARNDSLNKLVSDNDISHSTSTSLYTDHVDQNYVDNSRSSMTFSNQSPFVNFLTHTRNHECPDHTKRKSNDYNLTKLSTGNLFSGHVSSILCDSITNLPSSVNTVYQPSNSFEHVEDKCSISDVPIVSDMSGSHSPRKYVKADILCCARGIVDEVIKKSISIITNAEMKAQMYPNLTNSYNYKTSAAPSEQDMLITHTHQIADGKHGTHTSLPGIHEDTEGDDLSMGYTNIQVVANLLCKQIMDNAIEEVTNVIAALPNPVNPDGNVGVRHCDVMPLVSLEKNSTCFNVDVDKITRDCHSAGIQSCNIDLESAAHVKVAKKSFLYDDLTSGDVRNDEVSNHTVIGYVDSPVHIGGLIVDDMTESLAYVEIPNTKKEMKPNTLIFSSPKSGVCEKSYSMNPDYHHDYIDISTGAITRGCDSVLNSGSKLSHMNIITKLLSTFTNIDTHDDYRNKAPRSHSVSTSETLAEKDTIGTCLNIINSQDCMEVCKPVTTTGPEFSLNVELHSETCQLAEDKIKCDTRNANVGLGAFLEKRDIGDNIRQSRNDIKDTISQKYIKPDIVDNQVDISSDLVLSEGQVFDNWWVSYGGSGVQGIDPTPRIIIQDSDESIEEVKYSDITCQRDVVSEADVDQDITICVNEIEGGMHIESNTVEDTFHFNQLDDNILYLDSANLKNEFEGDKSLLVNRDLTKATCYKQELYSENNNMCDISKHVCQDNTRIENGDVNYVECTPDHNINITRDHRGDDVISLVDCQQKIHNSLVSRETTMAPPCKDDVMVVSRDRGGEDVSSLVDGQQKIHNSLVDIRGDFHRLEERMHLVRGELRRSQERRRRWSGNDFTDSDANDPVDGQGVQDRLAVNSPVRSSSADRLSSEQTEPPDRPRRRMYHRCWSDYNISAEYLEQKDDYSAPRRCDARQHGGRRQQGRSLDRMSEDTRTHTRPSRHSRKKTKQLLVWLAEQSRKKN